SLELLKDSPELQWQSTKAFHALLRCYKPRVVHCHYTGFISPYPWLSRLCSAEKIFFTDHRSRPEGYVRRSAPLWKRTITRLVNYPLTCVQCVSNYGYECNVMLGVLPRGRYKLIYNGVDICRATAGLQSAEAFRRKHCIPDQRAVVVQVSWIIREK